MSYMGSWKVDDLLVFVCNTHTVTTGAATDADAVPTYRVYEDETGTAILTGSMALLDSANTAGFYSEQITLSAANGFEKGKCYSVYISATVNSVVGTTHRTFQMEAEVDSNSASNIGANVITAASIATGAIDADAIADGAIDAGAFAADAITAAKIADGAIDAATFAAGAITATVIATGAIDADALAADAVTEIAAGITIPSVASIADGVWDEATVGHTTAGTFGEQVKTDIDAILEDTGTTLQGELDGIQADTEDIQTRLPAALVSGRMDSSVGAMAANTLTAAASAADFVTEVQAGLSTLDAAGIRTAVGLGSANLDTQLDALPTNAELATALASADDAVLTAIDALPTNAELATALGTSDDATLAAIAALNNLSAAQVNAEVVDALTVDVIADTTPALGSRPTIAQGILMGTRFNTERSVTGTTTTIHKEDGAATAYVVELDDADDPTAVTRAS
jgi:hypothetical protein